MSISINPSGSSLERIGGIKTSVQDNKTTLTQQVKYDGRIFDVKVTLDKTDLSENEINAQIDKTLEKVKLVAKSLNLGTEVKSFTISKEGGLSAKKVTGDQMMTTDELKTKLDAAQIRQEGKREQFNLNGTTKREPITEKAKFDAKLAKIEGKIQTLSQLKTLIGNQSPINGKPKIEGAPEVTISEDPINETKAPPLPPLPTEMKQYNDKSHVKSPQGKEDLQKLFQDAYARGSVKLKDIKVEGGHGSNKSGSFKVGNDTHNIFLKPKDDTEVENYKIIQELSPDLAKFMPKFYGEVEIDDKKYIVMENTRDDGKNKFEQLADIKLAGKVKVEGGGGHNPIANQGEQERTRGKAKSTLGFNLMKLGALVAPDYQVIKSSSSIKRFFNFIISKNNLTSALREKGVEGEDLNTLVEQLHEIKRALVKSGVALIGASVILMKDEKSGEVKPILIDPAHMHVDPRKRNVEEKIRGAERTPDADSSASQQDFIIQRHSNGIALDSLIRDLETLNTNNASKGTIFSKLRVQRDSLVERGTKVSNGESRPDRVPSNIARGKMNAKVNSDSA